MIAFLFGQDSYRRQKKCQEIVAAYQKKHGTAGTESFDLNEDGQIDKLKEFLGAQSLFAKKKLGIVRIDKKLEVAAKNIFKSALKDDDTTLIIISDTKPPKGFEFLLKEPAKKEEFAPLSDEKRKVFILKEAEARELKLSPEQASALLSIEDSWEIITQLDTLALGGELEATSANPEFFPLIQTALSTRVSVGDRLTALHHLLTSYDSAAAFNIMAAMASPELKGNFADYDIMKKSGKLDFDDALLDFVLSA